MCFKLECKHLSQWPLTPLFHCGFFKSCNFDLSKKTKNPFNLARFFFASAFFLSYLIFPQHSTFIQTVV